MNTHLLHANSIRIKKFQSLTSYFLHIYSCHLHFHQAKSWFEIVLCVEKSSNHCILTTYQYQRGRIYCLSIKLVISVFVAMVGFCCLWLHCSCPSDQVTSKTAPAHPHATGVAVFPALFQQIQCISDY